MWHVCIVSSEIRCNVSLNKFQNSIIVIVRLAEDSVKEDVIFRIYMQIGLNHYDIEREGVSIIK